MNGRIIGVALGLVLGIILCLVVFVTANKNGKIKTEYDERQNEIRGKGFKYAFFTALVMLGIFACLDVTEIYLPISQATIYMFIVATSVGVDAVYNILNDGYWGLNNDKKKYEIFMAIIGLFNLGWSLFMYVDGRLIVDGVLSFAAINLICGILFLVLFVAMFIKSFSSKDDEGEDMV